VNYQKREQACDSEYDIGRIVKALTTDDVLPPTLRLLMVALEYMTPGEMRRAYRLAFGAEISKRRCPSESAIRGVLTGMLREKLRLFGKT
jgi:hypothetical protein